MFPPNYLHQHSRFPPNHNHKTSATLTWSTQQGWEVWSFMCSHCCSLVWVRCEESSLGVAGELAWMLTPDFMVSGSSGIQQTEQLEFKVHTPSAHHILFSGTTGWYNRDWYHDFEADVLIFHVLLGPNRHPVLFFHVGLSWCRPVSFVNWRQELPWPVSRGTSHHFNVKLAG